VCFFPLAVWPFERGFLLTNSRLWWRPGAARVLRQAVGNQGRRRCGTSGLRRAGRAAWGPMLPDHVPGLSIFPSRSLTCRGENNRGGFWLFAARRTGAASWDVSWPWLTLPLAQAESLPGTAEPRMTRLPFLASFRHGGGSEGVRFDVHRTLSLQGPSYK